MTTSDLSRTELLRLRKQHCVCKYCGSELMVQRLVFSTDDDVRIELVCSHCQRIEQGVEKEIYLAAQYYVDEIGFDYFPNLDHTAKTQQMNIAKVAELITWGFANLGYLNAEGFTYPLNGTELQLSEAMIVPAEALEVASDANANS